MSRVFLLLAALALCIWQAPGPDPRWLAAVNSSLTSFLPTSQSGPPLSQDADGDFRLSDGSGRSFRNAGQMSPLRHGDGQGYRGARRISGESYAGAAAYQSGRKCPAQLRHCESGTRTNRCASSRWSTKSFFHLFVVSQDLKFFLHTHPERNSDNDFQLTMRFSEVGDVSRVERLLSDRRHAAADREYGDGTGRRIHPRPSEDRSGSKATALRKRRRGTGAFAGGALRG